MVAIDVARAAGVAASIALAAVMLVAGVSKLAGDWRADASALGVPWWLAAPVPVAELVLGALLAAQVARPIVAWCALALLVVFSGFVALQLSHGRRPPCACFGGWSTKPLGVGHLVRNGVFAALALVAALA